MQLKLLTLINGRDQKISVQAHNAEWNVNNW